MKLTEDKVKKLLLCALLALLAVVSILIIADKASDAAAHAATIGSIDGKAETVLKLSAASALASAGITAIPGDTATPIAEKLADFTEYFLLILCVLYAEKYLLAIIPAGVFRLLVPLACLAFIVGTLRSSRRWAVQGGKPAPFPVNTAARDPAVQPSTSFSGARRAQASASKARSIRGRNSRQPWIPGSSLICRMVSSSASREQSEGRVKHLTPRPIFSQRFMAPVS